MQNLAFQISQMVGVTLMQSLVQGIFVYLLLRIALPLVPGNSATGKYYVAGTALGGLAVWFIYGLLSRISSWHWAAGTDHAAFVFSRLIDLPVTAKGFSFNTETYYYKLSGLFTYMAAIYVTGLCYHSVVLVYSGNRISKIRKSASVDINLLKQVKRLSALLCIDKKIITGISALINVPCTAGYFKPIILLPVSLVTTLSTDEVEAILLHELAHIKRNDYVLNLVQQVMAAILFFNPFALLIGRIINSERENSCDDMVVKQTAKPLVYAQALLKLQQTQNTRLQLTLAASGKKYYLLNRIERIMKTKKPSGNMDRAVFSVILFAASISCIAWLNPKKANTRATLTITESVAVSNSLTDTSGIHAFKRLQTDTDTTKRLRTRYQQHSVDSAANKMTYDSYQNFSPEQQSVIDSAAKKGKEMAKRLNSPEWKAQVDAMQKNAKKMTERFNSPEWKAQVDKMAKEGAAMAEKFDSPEWKAQLLAMGKQSDDITGKFNNPEWKAQINAMQKQAEQMADRYNSPEWKAQVDKMAQQGAAIAKKFNSPEWKKQVERMQKQAELMSKKFNSPEWKRETERMQKQAAEITKKFNSPAWKAKMNKWNSAKQDSTLVKEQPEKPEQPEKEEQPEKTEVN